MRHLILPALVFAILGTPAYAADGVLEINQACALNGGCFEGDDAGFPVRIEHSGSYRLTGNIDLAEVFATTAIEVSAPNVHLDLNGFSILGPSTCTGIGQGLSCTRDDGGYGVDFLPTARSSSVANGTVRGMAGSGIRAGSEGIRVSDIIAERNSLDGIEGGPLSSITDCTTNYNGDQGVNAAVGSIVSGIVSSGNRNDGIVISGPAGLVHGNSSSFNGASGFVVAARSKFGENNHSVINVTADDCGGGICTAQRRYFLTDSIHNGDEADSAEACGFGFHLASIGELRDYSNFRYDYRLGFTHEDSGTGPPLTAPGWIRTGFLSRINTLAQANCALWTSADGAHEGTSGAIWTDSAGAAEFPWLMVNKSCGSSQRVWCIED